MNEPRLMAVIAWNKCSQRDRLKAHWGSAATRLLAWDATKLW